MWKVGIIGGSGNSKSLIAALNSQRLANINYIMEGNNNMTECINNYSTQEEFDNKFMVKTDESKKCSSCLNFVEEDGIYYCKKFNK